MIPLMVDVGGMRINAAWVVTESLVMHKGQKYLVLTMGFPVSVPTTSALALGDAPVVQTPFQVSIQEEHIATYRDGFERAKAEFLDACAGIASDDPEDGTEPEEPPDVSRNGKHNRN